MKDLNKQELSEINGGGGGSREGARLAGRLVGTAIGGPIAMMYYAGCDLDWW
ncbi:MAG: hypothetical protein Q4G08_03450 [Capnocytophaga sp.]|nr:hypothetical protein [Capnocytophaga sp.]